MHNFGSFTGIEQANHSVISFYARQQNVLRVLAMAWASVRLSVTLSVRLSQP